MLMYSFDEFIRVHILLFLMHRKSFYKRMGQKPLRSLASKTYFYSPENSLNSTILDFQNRAIRLNVSEDIFLFNSP